MMRLRIPALILAATLAAPAVLPAGAETRSARERRVYDRAHRDYHVWNHDEDVAYRQYLAERHRRYLTYERQRRAERLAYWRWRHERLEHH
jgi:hypothetical protein